MPRKLGRSSARIEASAPSSRLRCQIRSVNGGAQLRQTAIASFKFPLKLAAVTQVDSKASPAVQLADVMIGAALEAANRLAGLKTGGLDPETVIALFKDEQFIHLIPDVDFEGQQRFRQGTQATEVIDYFTQHFAGKR